MWDMESCYDQGKDLWTPWRRSRNRKRRWMKQIRESEDVVLTPPAFVRLHRRPYANANYANEALPAAGGIKWLHSIGQGGSAGELASLLDDPNGPSAAIRADPLNKGGITSGNESSHLYGANPTPLTPTGVTGWRASPQRKASSECRSVTGISVLRVLGSDWSEGL